MSFSIKPYPSKPVIKKNDTVLSSLVCLQEKQLLVLTISYHYLLNREVFNYLNKSHIFRRLMYFLNLGEGGKTILGKHKPTIIKNLF